MKFDNLVNYILEGVSGLKLKGIQELTPEQKQKLNSLLDQADSHPEFSGGGYVKGEEKDKQRLVAIIGDEVVGFMTPRFQQESGYWRAGAIFIDPEHQGRGYAAQMLGSFFEDSKHLPARVWISNTNKSSQGAFSKAGFIKDKEKNLSDDPNDRGFNWIKT